MIWKQPFNLKYNEMKRLKYSIAAIGFAAGILTIASCNDRNNASDSNGMNNAEDTNLTNTRRNATDTVNYLTNDSASQSQDVIDPNPPGQ